MPHTPLPKVAEPRLRQCGQFSGAGICATSARRRGHRTLHDTHEARRARMDARCQVPSPRCQRARLARCVARGAPARSPARHLAARGTKFRERGAVHMPSGARVVSQAVSEAVSRARLVSQPVSCERRRAGGRRAGRARSSQERNESRAGRWDRRRGRTKCVHIPTEGRDPAVSCHLDRRCPRASRATTTLCSTLSWSVTRRL